MKTRYWLPFAALAAFAADCGTEGTETGDSATDTFCYDCDFLTNSVALTCAGDVVTADAAYSAWASSVSLHIVNTGDGAFDGSPSSVHDEVHLFASTDNVGFAADGTADAWQLQLDAVDNLNDVVEGTTTLMGCDFYDTNATGVYLSIAAQFAASPTTDYDNATATCAIFGDQSASAFSGDGCECFEEFLQTPPANPCGDHS